MKGLKLQINKKQVCGAIENGITGVLVTCKEDKYRVFFSSLGNEGNTSYTWYASDLEMNDTMDICLEDITEVPIPIETRNYNKPEEERLKEDLEIYHRLKQELMDEGLI